MCVYIHGIEMIDWLIDWRQASSISAIFGKRARSIIHVYKNYIEMREGMDQPGQQFLTATEKVWRVLRDTKFSLL